MRVWFSGRVRAKRKAHVHSGVTEAQKHGGIPYAVLRAGQDQRGDVIEVHGLTFIGSPTPIRLQELSCIAMDDESLNRFFGYGHLREDNRTTSTS